MLLEREAAPAPVALEANPLQPQARRPFPPVSPAAQGSTAWRELAHAHSVQPDDIQTPLGITASRNAPCVLSGKPVGILAQPQQRPVSTVPQASLHRRRAVVPAAIVPQANMQATSLRRNVRIVQRVNSWRPQPRRLVQRVPVARPPMTSVLQTPTPVPSVRPAHSQRQATKLVKPVLLV